MNCKRILKINIMNKKEYITPAIKITVCDLQDSFLAGSGNDKLWSPDGSKHRASRKKEKMENFQMK